MESDDLDLRRRRCLFRAEHLGTKEMDWLLGKYASAQLPGIDAEGMAFWEELVLIPDPQFYDWIMGAQVTENARIAEVVGAIRAFHGLVPHEAMGQ